MLHFLDFASSKIESVSTKNSSVIFCYYHGVTPRVNFKSQFLNSRTFRDNLEA
ncbi:hypothetical protein HanRHA438_Chr12g0556711 [Helianthus annuus]|uniref:Uncharacterized protein n=1 Tax=Helianthus annuus TaxID=4232 RepID=A0A9K3MWD1_HELAN|nr:hypothetical protein HanXRQr2_Chr12g0545341 [Helianthus annuus]KAJ0863012.1 hypothetical protein HanPSC8_Chr12g0524981 [Helianthus annuus]KAJ0866872.1 hypothetical protein HanRHA438_Chr12g0556711 [Helianthus annuus]